MVHSMRPAGLQLTLLLLALGATTPEDVAAKCNPVLEVPGFARGVPVMVLDGSVIGVEVPDGSLGIGRLDPRGAPVTVLDSSVIGVEVPDGNLAFGALNPDDVRSINIICWNPATGFGPSPGINVIAIRTVSFLQSTRAPLEQLLKAQDAHFAVHSHYARSLDALIDFGGPRDAMLELSATSHGWSAATKDNPAYRCAVYSGSATPVLDDMTVGEMACEDDDTRASRAMREWYEAL